MPDRPQNLGYIIAELFTLFVPIVRALSAELHQTQTGPVTDEQIVAKFNEDIEKILAEGAAWVAAHPRA